MIRFTPSCKLNVNGQCSKLRVKCLESRFMGIGGVEFGHCTIREAVQPPPMPRGAKLPGSNPGPPETTVSMERERKEREAREALIGMGLDKPGRIVLETDPFSQFLTCGECLLVNHSTATHCGHCGAEL